MNVHRIVGLAGAGARWIRLGLLALGLSFCSTAPADDEKISPYELHSKLLYFTDTYAESLSEVIDGIMHGELEPRARLGYQGVKVTYVSAAIAVATEPEPLRQLMDMMVLLRLQQKVWESGGFSYSEKEHADAIRTQLNLLEKSLREIASRVFTKEDIDSILSLADSWKDTHPERRYVAYVRFVDLPDSLAKSRLETSIRNAGLFASINEAQRQIEEARYTGERGLYLANHMPMLLEWQAELFLYRALANGDVRNLLERSEKLSNASDRLGHTLDTLPADVGAEVQKLMDVNHAPLDRSLQNLATASENFKVISEQLSPLLRPKGEGGNIDLQGIQALFTSLRDTSADMLTLSQSLSGFNYNRDAVEHLSGVLTEQREAINELVIYQQNRLGLIVAALIVLFFCCLTASLYVVKRKT